MHHRKTFDVHLKDHAVMPGNARSLVIPPRESRINHNAFHHSCGTVTAVVGQILVLVTNAVTEVSVTPAQVLYLLCIWIQQKLMTVKTHSPSRIIGAINAITIDKARTSFRQVTVPNLIGLFM